MATKLKALEKNILKYRALQTVLLLHEMESLRELIIGSIRSTDKIRNSISDADPELPDGVKKPFQKALNILVSKGIITENESADIQEINEIRNIAAHSIHELVIDITDSQRNFLSDRKYDYEALKRLEIHKDKIEKGLRYSHVILLSLRGVYFDQASETYKEELARLDRKIHRQYQLRYGKKS